MIRGIAESTKKSIDDVIAVEQHIALLIFGTNECQQGVSIPHCVNVARAFEMDIVH